ncbi:MAG: hypothetical protein IJS62_03935, partial [Bacteroidales bacterium]|nr:hypothetical protein [Bacteroidales bacterium]
MNNKKKSLAAVPYALLGMLALAGVWSCAKQELPEPSEDALIARTEVPQGERWLDVKTVPMTFEVSPEDNATKAWLSGTHFNWTGGDKIGLYDNLRPTLHPFTLNSVSSDGGTGYVTGEVTEGSTKWYAVYPQSAMTSFSDGLCDVTLPAVQHAGSRYVDPSALLAVSYTTGKKLSFHNVFALLTLKVDKSDITHIQIIGNQGSVLAGTVTVNASTGKISAIKDPKTEIHLYPSGSTFVTGQEYLVPVLPYNSGVEGSTPLEGFTLIMYTSSETDAGIACYVKRTDKTLSLARGEGQKLGVISSGSGFSSTTLASSSCTGYYSNKLDLTFPGGTSHAYRVALYRDAACTDMVVAYNIPATNLSSSGPFSAASSSLTFGGLDPDTQYWFRGIDRTTGQPTIIVRPHTTLAVERKTMAASASVGDVILMEDFGELCYGSSGDATGRGGPFRVSNISTSIAAFTPFRGEIREDSGVYYKASTVEMRLFTFGRNAIGATRLADWAEYSERQGQVSVCDETANPVCARNGMLKIGADKYT